MWAGPRLSKLLGCLGMMRGTVVLIRKFSIPWLSQICRARRECGGEYQPTAVFQEMVRKRTSSPYRGQKEGGERTVSPSKDEDPHQSRASSEQTLIIWGNAGRERELPLIPRLVAAGLHFETMHGPQPTQRPQVQEDEAGSITNLQLRSWRPSGGTCTAEMPTSADRKTDCVTNSSPATHQTLRQQRGTGQDGYLHPADWAFSVKTIEKKKKPYKKAVIKSAIKCIELDRGYNPVKLERPRSHSLRENEKATCYSSCRHRKLCRFTPLNTVNVWRKM